MFQSTVLLTITLSYLNVRKILQQLNFIEVHHILFFAVKCVPKKTEWLKLVYGCEKKCKQVIAAF